MQLLRALPLLCLLLAPCRSDTDLSGPPVLEPYDFLFDTAVEAYYKGDWLSVILNMEKALRNKATLRKVKAHCRLMCANQTAFGAPLGGLGVPIPGAGSVDDLGFFQKILKRADCVNSCETDKLGFHSVHQVSKEVELEFQKRTPYNYLQVAYFKINMLNKAVAAANTFFQANPDHVEMKQNLDYYRMMAGVQDEDFKDLEARPHMAQFLLGKSYYSDDSFGLAAEHFEAALDEYLAADKECRALCEGAYNYDGYNYMEYNADLFQTMTDHYMQVLNCKQHCAVELGTSSGRSQPFDDFLPSHFNYLQFSYYNSEKYEKAIECAKTFLLFHPNNEVMNQNLAFYSAMLGEDKAETISSRQVVRQFIQQSVLEKELLYFGYEAFGITFIDPDTWTPEDVMPKKLRDKQKAEREATARITEEIGNLMKEIETLVEEKKKDSSDMANIVIPQQEGVALLDDVKVTMTSKPLNSSQRVLLDAVISSDECRELHHLSNAAALQGDDYSGRPSPHSPKEMFQEVSVLKTVLLGQEGKVPLKSARLFFDLSEKVRGVLESYFHPDKPLYFSHSHLVCRTAIEEKPEDGADLGPPADDCLLVSELNECIKEPAASTHGDYSAVLYLNDDFEGGDFVFAEQDGTVVTAEVRPRCGRVVGFGASKETVHGVRAVTKGQRCAVALRFTLDPAQEEKERTQASDVLKMLSTPANSSHQQPAAQEAAVPSSREEAGERQDAAETTREDAAHVHADSEKTASKATKTKKAPKAKVKKDKAVSAGSGEKQKVKAQGKQLHEKDASKKTAKVRKDSKKAKTPSTSASKSQIGKEEL